MGAFKKWQSDSAPKKKTAGAKHSKMKSYESEHKSKKNVRYDNFDDEY